MHKLLFTISLLFILLLNPSANAGDNDDASDSKVQAANADKPERDPFQLPENVKRKGLAAELNKLQPAAGSDNTDNIGGYIKGY